MEYDYTIGDVDPDVANHRPATEADLPAELVNGASGKVVFEAEVRGPDTLEFNAGRRAQFRDALRRLADGGFRLPLPVGNN